MPDIPRAAVRAAAEVLLRQYESECNAGHLTWRDFEHAAREVLDAAAPALGEHAAQEILAHCDRYAPLDAARLGMWRRHFGIAARVAADALLTADDQKRLAAGALGRAAGRDRDA